MRKYKSVKGHIINNITLLWKIMNFCVCFKQGGVILHTPEAEAYIAVSVDISTSSYAITCPVCVVYSLLLWNIPVFIMNYESGII
jgi:hypothetical protein